MKKGIVILMSLLLAFAMMACKSKKEEPSIIPSETVAPSQEATPSVSTAPSASTEPSASMPLIPSDDVNSATNDGNGDGTASPDPSGTASH